MNKYFIDLKFGVAAALLLILSACGGAKKVASNKPTQTVEIEKNYDELYKNAFVYNTFSGKIKMNYEGKNQKQNFTTNLKMQKNEKIWASIVALGVAEVARALITPDRLQAVERINRNAYDMSFQEGVEKLNAPITFPMMENLLIGNPILAGLKVKSTNVVGSDVVLTMDKDGYVQELTYDIATKTLKKQIVKSDAKKFVCTIIYGDYAILGGQNFAKSRNITIEDKSKNETTLLDMDFNSYDLNIALEFNFSIPANYKKKSL